MNDWNFDMTGSTPVAGNAQTETKEWNQSTQGIFGEIKLEQISRFDEIPADKYSAKASSFAIKLVNGAPMAAMSYQIVDGNFKGRFVTENAHFFKWGTTDKDDRAIKKMIVFLGTAFNIAFNEARQVLQQYMDAFEQLNDDLIVNERNGFPSEAPIGTLEIVEKSYEFDGIQRVKKYYNFSK